MTSWQTTKLLQQYCMWTSIPPSPLDRLVYSQIKRRVALEPRALALHFLHKRDLYWNVQSVVKDALRGSM
ncbi:hypothetical protein LCGC14_0769610 [marine sediment metagenome]|uniref:Uncharacterized protein n=1 Tax=marine sediment metagenome TaxID=412755 RepID=A0A0F9Q2X8_9ZZZZ